MRKKKNEKKTEKMTEKTEARKRHNSNWNAINDVRRGF